MGDGIATAFVGRAGQLRALHAALSAARNGRAQFVLVLGEAGIGKSALLRQFLRQADGVLVVAASGAKDETGLPYGVIEQLWAAMPPGMTGTSSARAAGDSLASGADLLDGIGRLERLGPVVLAIDDLHWIDTASARALLFVLRRLHRDQVLVVAAARDQAIERLGDSWSRLFADDDLAAVVRLDGLDGKEVRELATARGWTISATAGERLREHTAGNPLYVSTLLHELPMGALEEATPLPAPRSYAATVLARLARLTPETQALVAAASVLGSDATLQLAAAVAGASDAIDAADQAIDLGLLEVRGNLPPGQVGFPHPLIRAAIYDDLSPSRRRALHGAVAGLLDGPKALRHRVAAAPGPDRQLVDQLCAAAEQHVALGLMSRAASYFELAARVEPDPATADEFLYRAVTLLLVASDMAAVRAYAELVRARQPSAYRQFILAMLDTLDGQLPAAIAELEALAGTVSPHVTPGLYAEIVAGLAQLSAMRDDHERAIYWAGRAGEVAGASVVADNAVQQAAVWTHAKTGRIRQALAMLADCDPGHLQPTAFEADRLTARGVLRTWVGEFDAALVDLRAVERWVRMGVSVWSVPLAYAGLAAAEFGCGSWDAAATHVELAVSLGEDLGHPAHLPYAHALGAQLWAARGADRLAASHAEAAGRVADNEPGGEQAGYAALAEAHRAWALGDWPGVEAALWPLHDGPARSSAEHPDLVGWRYRLAEAWIERGRPDAALTLLDQVPNEPRPATATAERARLRARALHGRGDVAGAKRTFTRALADRPGPPATFADALLRLDYGRFLLATGQAPAAVDPLRSARELLRRLGAAPFREACDTALTACGIAAAATSPPRGLDRLTARERVVAHLVAGGATNREVAAELYFRIKGVEYHLGNIFRKLGITSRRQLRGALAASERAAPREPVRTVPDPS